MDLNNTITTHDGSSSKALIGQTQFTIYFLVTLENMADPVGLAASISTLGGLMVTILKFAMEVKQSSKDLRRYHVVLESIKRVIENGFEYTSMNNAELLVSRRLP